MHYGYRRLKIFTSLRLRFHDFQRWKPKFVNTTDSNHSLPIFENILNRNFKPVAANQAWVSDITYIRTRSGWLYLAAVLDLYSRKIVGWAMAPTMPAELVCTALQLAICQRQPRAGPGQSRLKALESRI